MKEEYTEIYRYNGDHHESIIYVDNTISVPLFRIVTRYNFPSLEEINIVDYVNGYAVKAMMEVVKQYEEKTAN